MLLLKYEQFFFEFKLLKYMQIHIPPTPIDPAKAPAAKDMSELSARLHLVNDCRCNFTFCLVAINLKE
jgi:hypothetical protein